MCILIDFDKKGEGSQFNLIFYVSMLPKISFLGYPILIIFISYFKACASRLVLIKFYQDLTISFWVIFKIVNSA